MSRGYTVQHVGLQHGVVGDAVQFNAVAGQDIAVKLEVLDDQQRLLRFQQGAQFFQRLAARDLPGRAFISVGQGHVGRLPGVYGKRHSHQFRLQVIQVGGFRIEGKHLGRGQFFNPAVQVFNAQHGLIIHCRRRSRLLRRRAGLLIKQVCIGVAHCFILPVPAVGK